MDALATYGAATGTVGVVLGGVSTAWAIHRDRQVGRPLVQVTMVRGSERAREVMVIATNRSPFAIGLIGAGLRMSDGAVIGVKDGEPPFPITLAPFVGSVQAFVSFDHWVAWPEHATARPLQAYVMAESRETFSSPLPPVRRRTHGGIRRFVNGARRKAHR